MDIKKLKDLNKLSDVDLQKEFKNCRETLFKLRFQKVVEEIPDISIIKKTRRTAARILTILSIRKRQPKPVEPIKPQEAAKS